MPTPLSIEDSRTADGAMDTNRFGDLVDPVVR